MYTTLITLIEVFFSIGLVIVPQGEKEVYVYSDEMRPIRYQKGSRVK